MTDNKLSKDTQNLVDFISTLDGVKNFKVYTDSEFRETKYKDLSPSARRMRLRLDNQKSFSK